MSVSRSKVAARPFALVSSMVMLPPNASSAMPAEKCLPLDEITSARASLPRCSVVSTASGSRQNTGLMVFMASSRFRTRWVTWLVTVRSNDCMVGLLRP
ncbi:MAG: hypothetical protein JWP65_2664 [Ramlibacter sp.]|nr:hypothetical protein [Ramlibacter sp.]